MGAVRLVSVLIAAVTMDLAGRKVLLYVSGECPHSDGCILLTTTVWTAVFGPHPSFPGTWSRT